MVLSDRDIRKHLDSGKIKVTPALDLTTQLGSCSVDFRLGTKFRVFEHSRFAYIDLRKGVDIDEIMREVEIGPDESFTLHPGQLVLGMTIESLELAPDLLARLEGRSSLGRLGIIVHGTASVFDPGWIGNPTLELGNVGILPVSLYAGMRICSFTFETLSSPVDVPYAAKKGNKYAHQSSPLASKYAEEQESKTQVGKKGHHAVTEAERLTRPRVEALDSVLGVAFPVLDDGFIRVVDYMGDDGSVVQAARVSYGAGTKKVHEDRGLIRYLLRHAHTTPFEMCEIKFHVRVPMDAWRQWIRHRMANVNEYSTRYSVAIDAAQRTTPDKWRAQSSDNRQGSAGYLPAAQGEALTKSEAQLQDLARSTYDARLAAGVAREQARKDLPLSTYTEVYWKVDLHNLLHFLRLRMDDHAQEEIRAYAIVMGEQIVAKWMPLVWEAFTDYRQQSMFLSRAEIDIVTAMAEGRSEHAKVLFQTIASKRERDEIEAKLAKLGFSVPWSA